jgi:MFS family permease
VPTVYLVFLIVLLNMSAYRGSKVLITLFAIEFDASQLLIGMLIAMYSLFPVFLGLYAGRLTDRLGVRLLMIAGSCGVAAAFVLPYLMPGMTALFLSAALIGASWVFYNVCVQNLVGLLSTPDTRARNFSNYGLVMALGSFFGPLLAGVSIDHYGHARSYLLIAMLPLLAVIVIVLSRSIAQVHGKVRADEEKAVYSSNLLSNPPLRRTLVTSAIVMTGTDLFQFYMPIYGHAVGLSASAIGVVLAMFAVAAFVVRLVMPALVKYRGADAVLVGALFIGGASYLMFPFFEHVVLLSMVAFILGLGMGCSQPVSLMLIYDRAPAGRSGEALGLRLTINNFMHITVPMVFGTLGSAFGVAPVFLTNAVILTAGGIISRKANRPY